MTLFLDKRPIPRVGIHYRTKIGVKSKDTSTRLLSFYLSPWNNFMHEFTKLEKTRAKYLEMPALREKVSSQAKLADLLPLFRQKNPQLHRLLLEVGPMFDNAPHDLKVFIFAIVGITAEEYTKFVTENCPQYEHYN